MKNVKKIALILVILVVIIFIGSRVFAKKSSTNKPSVQGTSAQKTQTINKDFVFNNLKFTVGNASLNNQIVIEGQNATAIAGRTFLIVTLKIANDANQSIQMNTRDYVRLSVNKDESTWLAPDIHNDPVEVQAISTKFTRVGFAINNADNNLVLQIGEIKGDKQKIALNDL
jgi:hypothetical protein